MRLFYYESERGNFGDDLNVWLWDALLPGWRDWNSDSTLFGVGTILNEERLAQSVSALVMGSGAGYGPIPTPETRVRCDFRAVRGPLTRAALGLPDETPLLDAAMMIPTLPGMSGGGAPARPVFIPHYSTAILNIGWEDLCDGVGLDYLSPEGDSRDVIRRIAASPLVVTESMHGAIMADAYRVPWVAVRVNDRFNSWKWEDWAGAFDMEVSFIDALAELRTLGRIATRLNALRSRRPTPSPASPPTAGDAKPASNETAAPDRQRLRAMIEKAAPLLRMQLRRKLRKALRTRPSLSDGALLARRQQAFGDVCARTADDYAKGAVGGTR